MTYAELRTIRNANLKKLEERNNTAMRYIELCPDLKKFMLPYNFLWLVKNTHQATRTYKDTDAKTGEVLYYQETYLVEDFLKECGKYIDYVAFCKKYDFIPCFVSEALYMLNNGLHAGFKYYTQSLELAGKLPELDVDEDIYLGEDSPSSFAVNEDYFYKLKSYYDVPKIDLRAIYLLRDILLLHDWDKHNSKLLELFKDLVDTLGPFKFHSILREYYEDDEEDDEDSYEDEIKENPDEDDELVSITDDILKRKK